MKRAGHLYSSVCSYENLYQAFKKAVRGKRYSPGVPEFYFDLENKLLELQKQLEQKIYDPSPYQYFMIYDPKERQISVAPFRDRVIHHALCKVIEPIFEASFISDTYACRKGKGPHQAVRRAQDFSRENGFYLKGDIKKYFASINHDIILDLLKRKIKDREVIELCAKILKVGGQGGEGEGLLAQGLPIGNLTSQFWANLYLSPFDHYLKEVERKRYYLRYMDDFIIFDDSKEELISLLKRIESFLAHRLRLKLKKKAVFINRTSLGVPFLGFRIFPGLIRIRRENLKRFKKKLSQNQRLYQQDLIGLDHLVHSTQGLIGYTILSNSHRLRQKIFVTTQVDRL